MNGVPALLDLTPFVSTTLDYITVSRYQITFVFSGDPRKEKDHWITAEGYWEIRDEQSVVVDNAMENDERDVYRFHRLLSCTVTETRVNPPTSFTLTFDNGLSLTFVFNLAGHECCSIETGKGEIHIPWPSRYVRGTGRKA